MNDQGSDTMVHNPCPGEIRGPASVPPYSAADTLRRHESEPLAQTWWVGYLRGLCRAYHRNFGTDEEHAVWLGLANSDDATQAAQGRGCAADHTLEPRDPDCVSEKARSEEKSRLADLISDSGPLTRFGVSKTAGRVPGIRSK